MHISERGHSYLHPEKRSSNVTHTTSLKYSRAVPPSRWQPPGGPWGLLLGEKRPYYQGPHFSRASIAFGCFLYSPSVALKLYITKRISTCVLGIRFGWSQLMVPCHWLGALSTAMCEMPSDGNPRQTTALSASHRSPCFAFLTVLLCATYAMHFLLMLLWWPRLLSQGYHKTAEKLMLQGTSSRKIHLTWWQLVSIRENLIYLRTITLAISFRLTSLPFPKPRFNQRQEEKVTSLNLARKRTSKWRWCCLEKRTFKKSLIVVGPKLTYSHSSPF